MDFSERKCSGDGLGIKNRSVISLKMVANSILNLSVFIVFWAGEKDPRSFGGRTDRQTGGGGQTDRRSGLVSPIKSVGFTGYNQSNCPSLIIVLLI